MSIRAAIATIAACTVLFAGIGGSIGWALGTYFPGYYRSVFRSSNEPWFDPVSVGVGQGLTQGVTGGVVVGLIVVVIFVWRDSWSYRQAALATSRAAEPGPAPERGRDPRFAGHEGITGAPGR